MPRLSRPRRRPQTALNQTVKKGNEKGVVDGKRRSGGALRFASVSVEDMEAGGRSKWPQAFWVLLSPPGHPSKRRLMTVQDFFRYTEDEGKKFFDDLDSDQDGRVSLDDLKEAMRKRKLPDTYAHELLKRARGGRWWAKSIRWAEFKMVADERESEVLRAFTALKVSPRGRLELGGIKDSLKFLGLPATEENAVAMLRALDSDQDGFVSYGKFRNFAVLLPKHKLQESLEPSVTWFESATMVPLGPVPEPGEDTGKMLLTAALAGGLASGLSTFLLHPLDTIKTRVQSTVGASIMEVAKSVPKIGAVGLYRGVLPATTGSGLSHGVRTCAYEGTLKVLTTLTGGAAELQMQGLASGVGTLLGTAFRIPCEVLKQRLQVGQHDSVQEALSTALKVDGPKSLFSGTTATLSREVPFYMFGIVFYQILKKAFRGELFGQEGRDLMPWETLMVGALSGALGAIVTTPADVIKTRIMTAPVGSKITASQILIDILKAEGLPALFKGALPRAVWIAPLGAMNFAGYELAKNALSKSDSTSLEAADLQPETDEMPDQRKVFAVQNVGTKAAQPESSAALDDVAKDPEPLAYGSSVTSHSDIATEVNSGTDVSRTDNEIISAMDEEIQQPQNREQTLVSGGDTISREDTTSGEDKTVSSVGSDAAHSSATTEEISLDEKTAAEPEASGNMRKTHETRKSRSQGIVNAGEPSNDPSKGDNRKG